MDSRRLPGINYSICHFATLQKIFVDFFFEFTWEFCIEKWRGFWYSEQNSGGTKIRKIRGIFRSAAFLTSDYGNPLLHLCSTRLSWVLAALRSARSHCKATHRRNDPSMSYKPCSCLAILIALKSGLLMGKMPKMDFGPTGKKGDKWPKKWGKWPFLTHFWANLPIFRPFFPLSWWRQNPFFGDLGSVLGNRDRNSCHS